MELTKINDKVVLREQNDEIEVYDFNNEITFSKLTKTLLSKNLEDKISLNIIHSEDLNENEQTLANMVKEILDNYNNKVEEFLKFKKTIDEDN